MKRAITLLMFLCAPAFAQVTLYTGQTNYRLAHDGIWYQEALPHTIERKPQSFSIEYSKNNWSLSYVDYGRITSAAIGVRDDQYDNVNHRVTDPKAIKVLYKGSGKVQGLILAYRKSYQSLFIDAGIQLTKANWEVDMPVWQDYETTKPFHLHVKHESRIVPFPVFAIGYKYDRVILKLTMAPTVGHGGQYQPIYRGISPNLSIGFTF